MFLMTLFKSKEKWRYYTRDNNTKRNNTKHLIKNVLIPSAVMLSVIYVLSQERQCAKCRSAECLL